MAEECGVTLAMHPDDPPISNFQGYPAHHEQRRQFRTPDRPEFTSRPTASASARGPSPKWELDIPSTIRRLGPHIKYVHFRDIRGTSNRFVETFHDEGQTDMVEAMRAYRDIGFDGPIRPDHVPQLAGEEEGEAGYTMLGRLFAVGYMRGLMQAVGEAR